MKYTDFYTNLILLLALQQVSGDYELPGSVPGTIPDPGSDLGSVSGSGSESDDSVASKASDMDPPPHQDVPRLITAKERLSLLELIKTDKHADIVTFFKENDLIDYPLIRFKSSEDAVNGYTPLAAAIRYCAVDTAKVLAPIQFGKLWTTDLGPRHSLSEISAKYCPELLNEAINDPKRHPLRKMIANLEISEITQMLADAMGHSESGKWDTYQTIVNWITKRFVHKTENSSDAEANEMGERQARPSRRDRSSNNEPLSTYENFRVMINYWTSSGRQVKSLMSYLKSYIHELGNGMYSDGIVQILKLTGNFDDFKEALNHFIGSDADKETFKVRSIMATLSFIEPAQLLQFDKSLLEKVKIILESSEINHKSFQIKSFNEFIPTDPRIDSVVSLYDLKDVKIIVPGMEHDNELFNLDNDDGINILDEMIDSYINDDPKFLETLLNTDHQFWSYITFDDFRFNFSPYQLTPIKAAVILKKPNILKYLLSRPNASMYVTTKDQLTALEMAACYKPDFLVENIVPLLKSSCSKRLRAANHVIGMFKDSTTNMCQTGAKNAPKILKSLMKSEKSDEIDCMDLSSKDYVVEAFIQDYPSDLIMGLHSTDHFNRNSFYLDLASKRGDISLIKYFIEKIQNLDKSQYSTAVSESLVTWIRFTDGAMSENNIQILEFFLSNNQVNKNAKGSKSGSTALSHATQRSLTWIVKRLLLESSLDVNIPDSTTLTTALQHSIMKFNNESLPNLKKGFLSMIAEALVHLGIPYESNSGFFNTNDELQDRFKYWLRMSDMTPQSILKAFNSEVGVPIEYVNDLFKRPDDPFFEFYTQLKEFIGNGPFIWLSITDNDEKYKKLVIDVNSNLNQIKASIKDDLMTELNLTAGQADRIKETISTDLKIRDFLESIEDKTAFQIVPIASEFFESVELYIQTVLESHLPAIRPNWEAFKVKLIIKYRLMNSIIKNISKDHYDVALKQIVAQKTSDHFVQGLLHNVLLAHPDIDTTISDSSNIDALSLTKTRAVLLTGNLDAADEMSRAHVRVRNIDQIHDGKKTTGRVFLGIASTVFIGSVSVVLIKWMI